ncbi:hypothetical protein ASPFODRAFT_30804 [Aspergillus luchuensis CBS 106.47]|uniref:Uncharacterized protein n=1 Tax=Aspergillus luchuensis (strain CBS 106.47) TaxID=1137211 RepID=A0A1M3TSV5_ASPLC|nr:hypothetical protein ASPFODRAFT_30804 [Aspergillus luchuensis CBS 106.47]
MAYARPELYRTVADNDTLQPRNRQLHDALTLSREYWYRLSRTACYVHGNGVNPELAHPHHMLCKVPSMHGWPHTTHALHIGASPSRRLCLQASVNWQLDEPTVCDRAKDRTDTVLLHIGTKSAVPYTLNGKDFSFWIGLESEEVPGPNNLAVLTLGCLLRPICFASLRFMEEIPR